MSWHWSYAVVLIALAGCGSDLAAPTVEQVEQEVGLWWAANWTFSSVTDPAMQRELTETGYEGHTRFFLNFFSQNPLYFSIYYVEEGGSFVNENGTRVFLPARNLIWDDGDVLVDGREVTLISTRQHRNPIVPQPWNGVLLGDTLRLEGTMPGGIIGWGMVRLRVTWYRCHNRYKYSCF